MNGSSVITDLSGVATIIWFFNKQVFRYWLPLLPLLELHFTTFHHRDLEGVVSSPLGVYDGFDRVHWKRPKR